MRLVLTTDTVGGVWTFTQELSRELLLRGHEVCLVSFGRMPSADQQHMTEELHRSHGGWFRCTWSDAPLEWMQNNGAAYDHGAALLLGLDAAFKPDVYILSQFCFGALPVAAPKVVVAHSDVVSWAAACGESLDESSDWMRTYRRLVANGLAQADAVVSPTAAYLRTLAACFPEMTHEQTVIANGRTVAPSATPPRMLQAVTAGRMWDKAKNLSQLRDCALPMPVVVAGESSTEDDDSGLRCVGQLDEQQLLRLFRASAVYVCTSVYEPFGLAPLEAALCGCAIVAMELPSLREVWGDAALFFEDAGSLSRVLTELRDDAELLSQRQAASQKRASLYTGARMTDAYLKLIQPWLHKQGRSEAHAA